MIFTFFSPSEGIMPPVSSLQKLYDRLKEYMTGKQKKDRKTTKSHKKAKQLAINMCMYPYNHNRHVFVNAVIL
jgi:hypothetical protein